MSGRIAAAKEWLGYGLYRVLSGVFGALPERAVRGIGSGLGSVAWRLAGRRRRLVSRHLRRVLGPEADTAALSKRMFRSYGRYWAEVFWIRPRRKTEVVAHSNVENVDRLTDAVASGRGVILALPHMGNWEIAGAKAEALGAPVLAAAEALSNRRIVDWFIEARAGMGIEVVLAGRGHRATAALAKRLREGGVIALLADRDISGRGIEVEFFGEKTTIPAGPAALAHRTGAHLLPVGSYFRDGRGHRFVIREPIEAADDGEGEEAVERTAVRLAATLESIIAEAPWDWHLFVPNWPSDREDS